MTEKQDNLSLPFNKAKQRATLGHILTNPNFFLQCRNQIKPHWFSEEGFSARIYKIQLDLYRRQGQVPTVEEVKGAPAVMAQPIADQQKIRNHIDFCLNETKNFRLAAIKDELTVWLKAVTFREVIEKATVAYNQEAFDRVHTIFQDVVKKTGSIQFDDAGVYPLDNLEAILERNETDRKDALTTGLKIFDQALLDGATNGGLQKGDTTMVLAPVNVGKTTFLISVAIHNVRRGKSVLFMTHEGRPDDIFTKMVLAMNRMTYSELLEAYRDPQKYLIVRRNIELLKRFLQYIPYNKPGMTVEQVEPIIRREQEKRMARTGGKGFDLVVSDYPAKLSTERASRGMLPRREIDRIVYDYYVQLALEYGFHALTAIQTNRDGSKINNGREDRLLTKEDVSESWGVMEMATNVITINRSPDAKKRNRVTFYVDKSRSSETGTAVVCNSRYDMSLTHAEDFGAIWYRGQATMEERVDDLLEQFGKDHLEIPESLIPE